MKYDELHRLIRRNGWQKHRQLGTSHIIYRKGTEITLYHITKEKKLGGVWQVK